MYREVTAFVGSQIPRDRIPSVDDDPAVIQDREIQTAKSLRAGALDPNVSSSESVWPQRPDPRIHGRFA